jgi:two-component sensor histidine kinase
MDGLDIVVCVVDVERDEILYVNKRLKDLFGGLVGRSCRKKSPSGKSGSCDFCFSGRLYPDDSGEHVWSFHDEQTGRRHSLRDKAFRWVDGRIVRLRIARDIADNRECYEHAEVPASAEARIWAAESEKEALLKEVHHRAKNNMQLMTSILNLQACYSAEQETRKTLMKIASRIKSMALVHENLYASGNLACIDFGGYLRNLAKSIFTALKPRSVAYSVEADKISLDINTAVPCGLLANELITNAAVHSFKDGRGGKVNIAMRSRGDGYRLVVRDNGSGLPEGLDVHGAGTMGMLLVTALVSQLKGRVEFERRGGTVVTVLF